MDITYYLYYINSNSNLIIIFFVHYFLHVRFLLNKINRMIVIKQFIYSGIYSIRKDQNIEKTIIVFLIFIFLNN